LQDGGLGSAIAVLIFRATGLSGSGVSGRDYLGRAVRIEVAVFVGKEAREIGIRGLELFVLDIALTVDELVTSFDRD
jgi:hypothetical protein